LHHVFRFEVLFKFIAELMLLLIEVTLRGSSHVTAHSR